MSLDMHVRLRDLPDLSACFPALHVEGSTGVETSQETAGDLHVANQPSSQAGDAMLLSIDGHVAFHGGKHLGFEIRRPELRIGLEVKQGEIALCSIDRPHECLR